MVIASHMYYTDVSYDASSYIVKTKLRNVFNSNIYYYKWKIVL